MESRIRTKQSEDARRGIGRTRSWEPLRTGKIKRIRLSPGRRKMVFRPDFSFRKGAQLNLREISRVGEK
ncbi:hypothetical protein BH24BAC1_BH24BAC1_31920 [soil metagenome]